MFLDCKAIEEHNVLGTDAEAASDLVQLCKDAVSIDDGIPRGGCVQAGEYGHGGGLPGTIVAQEGGDVVPVHVEGNILHCHVGLLWL